MSDERGKEHRSIASTIEIRARRMAVHSHSLGQTGGMGTDITSSWPLEHAEKYETTGNLEYS